MSSSSSSAAAAIIAPTAHLQGALHAVLEASHRFAQPDPQLRAQGEAVFLELRKADNALEYAAFFIGQFSCTEVSFPSRSLCWRLPGRAGN